MAQQQWAITGTAYVAAVDNNLYKGSNGQQMLIHSSRGQHTVRSRSEQKMERSSNVQLNATTAESKQCTATVGTTQYMVHVKQQGWTASGTYQPLAVNGTYYRAAVNGKWYKATKSSQPSGH